MGVGLERDRPFLYWRAGRETIAWFIVDRPLFGALFAGMGERNIEGRGDHRMSIDVNNPTPQQATIAGG